MTTATTPNTDIRIEPGFCGFANHVLQVSKEIYNPSDVRTLEDDLVSIWNGKMYVVKKGFITDGASVPRAMWRVIGHPWAHYMPAAVIHDAFYAFHTVSQKEADEALRDLMVSIGVSKWKANTMYAAVRAFGSFAYKDQTQLAYYANSDDMLEVIE